jgi:HEAT repeat protein/energy-coupling factor transporter ATP-binding protein EcfA2
VKVALKRHGFPSQKALALELGISRSTTDKFFTGKSVDYSFFVEISERLGLDWHAIAYIEEEPPIQVKSPSPTDTPPPPKGINWRQVCQDMLEAQNQRRLTTNPLTVGDGVAFELDEIYVPLGLVERKQQRRVGGDVSPDQGSRIYEPEITDEITKTFQQDEFFEQVLRFGRSRRIAIIGEPGAGKTTLLQKIAVWVLDNTEDIPIWISLADLQGKTLKAYLLQNWLEDATRTVYVSEEMQKALGELFNSKRVWLLLDAVDEMSVETYGNTPLQWIANQITGWIADARVVLTCRLNVWDAGKNALEIFEVYRNLDFSYGDAQTPDQVEQFIKHWFKPKPQLAEQLRAELDQPGRERIKDAVKNPLRLALLCRTWALGQGGLPNTKAGLYQQFTAALYEWKQDRFPTTSSQRQELNQALGELAKRAISEEKTKYRLRQSFVCSVLGEPEKELFGLALQLGWLNQVGVAAEAENRGEKVYAFYHPTFQEYFAAQAVEDWHYFLNHTVHNPIQGTYRIFEQQWKEVILLWLGRDDVPYQQKDEFIKALLEFKDGCGEGFFEGYRYRGFYEYRAYFLAALGIAEFSDCSQSDEIVTQLVEWGIGDFNPARAALQQTERRRAIAALVQLLSSTEDEITRRYVASFLRKIGTGNPEAIAALVQLLKSTEDETTRRLTTDSLGEIGSGSSEAINALVQLLESTKNEYICQQAVYNLGKVGIGNETALIALEQFIKSTEDENIRRLAVYNLWKVGRGNVIASISSVQLIKSTEDEYTYWQEVAAGSSREDGAGNTGSITALVQLLESTQDEEIRLLAATSLGELGRDNETAIMALVQLLKSTKNESIRRQVVSSLRKIAIGNSEAIAALVQLLQSTEDETTCRRTVVSLGEIGLSSPEAIKALVQIIESTKNEYTRQQAIYSLGKVGLSNPEAIKALMRQLDSSEDKYTRWQAASSLGNIDPGNSEAVKVLVQLLESTHNRAIRRQAADSLKKILRDEQLEEAIAVLKNYLSAETYDQNFQQFRECYEVIWHCAHHMSYSAFYQAWHTQAILTHPELQEITSMGSNFINQSLNLAELPRSLSAAVANEPILCQSIHLICIDGSKFIDRDNPATKIYTEMVKSGCPKCEDSTPKTMQELQAYWDLLDTDKRVVLVFYENTGFSETFLDALSKFDGAICVITAQTLDNIPLQCFSSGRAIADIVEWLKQIARCDR